MFRVPESSTPPATPAKRNFFDLPNPSTTPAGPPPTSFTAASTTPAGLPPSSVFGSVQNRRPIPFPASSTSRHGANTSPARTFQTTVTDDDDDDQEEDDYDAMDEDQILGSSVGSADDVLPSIEGVNFSAIAKSLAAKPATLTDSDDFILSTEAVIEDLSRFASNGQSSADDIDAALCTAVDELLEAWRTGQPVPRSHLGVGPGESAPPIAKAIFLSSLLFAIHHPARKSTPTSSFRSSRNNKLFKTIPEALIAWLKEYHNQFPNEFTEVLETQPNVCAHPRFWDIILSLALRGDLTEASRLMKEADFRQATPVQLEDENGQGGYRGKQLGNIQRVVSRAIAILDACPAVQSDDWNVKGNDWAIFRKRVYQALTDLETFAGGSNREQLNDNDTNFEAEHFGLSSVRDDELSNSTTNRRAESRIPWDIYQSLAYLYGQLLGYKRELVAASADWVEASICLTIWWDGEDSDMSNTALIGSKRTASRTHGTRQVDVMPRTAYQQRLSLSLRLVMSDNDEADLQVNTANAVQVGVACIFEGDIQGLLGLIRGWSTTISTGIVEVASLGSWLNANSAPSQSLMNRFNQSDLMVLSFGQQSDKSIKRDDVLLSYADQIASRRSLHNTRNNSIVEGWELAVQVLGRLSNTTMARTRIEEILSRVDIGGNGQIEKILTVCVALNLPAIGRRMAEKYSDHLAATSHDYGNALYYYARAHNVQRIKDVANMLVTSCLVQSAAYPSGKDMDSTLASIIKSPKQTLARLAALDHKAAELLSANISGYAMVRRFYDLRDQDIDFVSGHRLRPLMRSKEAAATLISLVESAADSIHGGLYDATVESVVQVDGLLTLLGEALMFLNQKKRILTSTQIFVLMQAAEDVSTISSTIYSRCEECLGSALAHAYGIGSPSSSGTMLGKSNPSLSIFSSYSMVDSGLSASGTQNKGASANREWDWRTGTKRDAKGDDVLKILRLELAREVSKVWTEGDI